MKTPYFIGPFASMCKTFVAQKRASDLIYEQQAMLLKMFDNFCKGYEIHDYTITKEVAAAWCVKYPNEKEITRRSRVAEMQRFAVFLCRQGHPSYLLPAIPKSGEKHMQYIFTKEEMASIFNRLDKIDPTNISQHRHLAHTLLFRMLYGCVFPKRCRCAGRMLTQTMACSISCMARMTGNASCQSPIRLPAGASSTYGIYIRIPRMICRSSIQKRKTIHKI